MCWIGKEWFWMQLLWQDRPSVQSEWERKKQAARISLQISKGHSNLLLHLKNPMILDDVHTPNYQGLQFKDSKKGIITRHVFYITSNRNKFWKYNSGLHAYSCLPSIAYKTLGAKVINPNTADTARTLLNLVWLPERIPKSQR